MKKILTFVLLSLSVGMMAQSKYVSPKTVTFKARWISQEYEVVRIGEYEWVNKNFHHNYTDAWFPNLNDWFMQVSFSNVNQLKKAHDGYYLEPTGTNPYNPATIVIGSKKPGKAETEYLLPDGKLENVKAKNFDYWFGAYYFGSRGGDGSMFPGNGQNTGNTVDYMHVVNKIPSGSPCPNTTNWELPTNNDIRQLLAMCPFDTKNGRLDAIAARKALTARRGQNPFASNIPALQGGNPGFKTYWFDISTNELGFNLMPAGQKYNDQEYVQPMQSGYKGFMAYPGDFQHLHYTASFPTQDGSFTLEDYLTFYEQLPNNRRYTVRWCRALTPEELGYNIWFRIDKGRYQIKKTEADPYKPWSTPQKPPGSSWKELEHGYLRGFYIKYIINIPNSPYTVDDIVDMWYNVDQQVFGQNFYEAPPSSQTRTKSLQSFQPNTLNTSEKENIEITIYPNPVDNILNIKSEQTEAIKSISIYSINQNKLVMKKDLNGTSQVDVSNLPTGIYSIIFETVNGGQSSAKMIKK